MYPWEILISFVIHQTWKWFSTQMLEYKLSRSNFRGKNKYCSCDTKIRNQYFGFIYSSIQQAIIRLIAFDVKRNFTK